MPSNTERVGFTRLFHRARREAIIVLLVWAAAMTWTVGYCYLRGYEHDADSWLVRSGLAIPRTPDNFTEIAGLPDWVAFGILLPWLICTAFTAFFCVAIMTDDELGGEAEEGGARGH